MEERVQTPWSVTELNEAVRDLLENTFLPVRVAGEISGLTIHRSGHVYLTLKDEHSQIRAVFFSGAEKCRALELKNGSLVEASGKIAFYTPRGECQLTLRDLKPIGTGTLQERFEAMKKRLAAEGLFDADRKKALPFVPRCIGIVTSPEGAAIRDFLQIINRRFPNVNIRIYPCMVQGQGAAEQVARGVEFFNRTGGADVIVVTRGGGSMEDLWTFNEERLARAVAASAIPVISAVGHEIDFTICDFAADLRVPTPSAAAELVIGKREEMAAKLERLDKDLRNVLALTLTRLRSRFERAAGSFVFREPKHLAEMRRQQLDELESRLFSCAENLLLRHRSRLDRLAGTLAALNPRRQLERGYAILFDPAENRPVTTSKLPAGTPLRAQLADGEMDVEVK